MEDATLHDLSAGADVLERVAAVARSALPAYGQPESTGVELINVSENATFRVADPVSGQAWILRVHRRGYHSLAAIESELAWLTAVRDDAGIRTPTVIPSRSGERIVRVEDADGGDPRACVMFELLPGTEPAEQTRISNFHELGGLTARLHAQARQWRRPAGFTRFRWDYDAAFGREARWGRWQDGIGVGPDERSILRRLDATLARRLAAFGSQPERFGLIHADLRLANLLVEPGGPTSVIDFDDCGFSWYLYDLGAALSFIEHEPDVPDMIDSWVQGYRTVLPLDAADEGEIWTFIMFRRLLLVAWIGSHSAADTARELGAGYTAGSCELAERYLTNLT